MRAPARLTALLSLLPFVAAGEAHASDSVSVEAGGGVARPGLGIPSSAFEYQRIAGRYEPIEALSLGAYVRLTHDFERDPESGTQLRTGGDWVVLLGGDTTIDLTKHLALGVALVGSPPSSRDIAAPLTRVDGKTAMSLVGATNSLVGGTADLTYDSFDEATPRPVDVSVTGALGYNYYATSQRVLSVDGSANGSTLPGGSADLSQIRFELGATATIYEDTDVGLLGGYYVYAPSDPASVGIFSGDLRGTAVTPVASFGTGVPLLPPRWVVRPELAERLGPVSLSGYYQYASYALPSEAGHTGGGKVLLKLGEWRPFASFSYRVDTAPDGDASSWFAGLGCTHTFR